MLRIRIRDRSVSISIKVDTNDPAKRKLELPGSTVRSESSHTDCMAHAHMNLRSYILASTCSGILFW